MTTTVSESPLQVTPVSITYFDPFDLFPSVKSEISNIFPLENLHWKSPQGPIRTIPKLSVTFTPESALLDTRSLTGAESYVGTAVTGSTTNTGIPQHRLPFIKFIIVNCLSIEEYRSKVRPLIRNWLPDAASSSSSGELISKPIIFLYANSEILDSNLFKSVSILDKFNKDFPQIQTLELRSVYRSPKEKEEFWNQLGQQIKTTLLSIFQTRLQALQYQLSKYVQANSETELLHRLHIQEELLQLYTTFGLFEEGMEQCYVIEKEFDMLCRRWAKRIPVGKLEIPFALRLDHVDPRFPSSSLSIANMFESDQLSEFLYLKYFFVSKLTLLNIEGNGSVFSPPIIFLKTYKLVRQFLTNIDRMFNDDSLVLKFKYLFLGSIIDLVPFEEALKVPVLSEALAELTLLQRDCWINGVLASTNYKLIDKDYPNLSRGTTYEFTGPEISGTYKDEDTFYETFMEFNKRLVTLYNSCGGKRRRTIDILSIEIGMLHYQRGEYRDAVDLFCSTYEYYIQTSWDCIGLHILRTFVNALIKCPDVKVLELGQQKAIPVSTVLGNAFLNILKMSRFDKEDDRTVWWDKFLHIERSKEDHLIYPATGLLSVTIDRNSLDLIRPNVYGLAVTLENIAIPDNVTLDSIRLALRPVTAKSNESRELLIFEQQHVDLKPKGEASTYILETKSVSFEKYEVVSVEVQVDTHTTFIEEFSGGQIIDIYRLYDRSNVTVEVTQSNSLELGSSFLDLRLSNFGTLRSSQITIRIVTSSGNELSSSPASSIPISFAEDRDLKEVTFNNLQGDTRIPYYITDTIDRFSLEVKTVFERPEEEEEGAYSGLYQEKFMVNIDCYLPISVSVEDIFKKEDFFFKFILGPSIAEEPVILYSSKLTLESNKTEDTDPKYVITGDYEPENPVILSSTSVEESCLNCYRLKAKKLFDTKDIFSLLIKYNTLRDLLDLLVTDYLLPNYCNSTAPVSKFDKWHLFWKYEILPLISYDYKKYCEESILQLDSRISKLKLHEITSKIKPISAMNGTVKTGVLNLLKKLASGVSLRDTDIEVDVYTKKLVNRELSVPVSLPAFEQLYSVELQRVDPSSESESRTKTKLGSSLDRGTSQIANVGTPLSFKVKIENLNSKWSTASSEESRRHIFEISSPNGEWLVQGKRRFALTDTETNEVDISLIPLKKGYLTFPQVEITTFDGVSSTIDYRNAYDSILAL